MKFTIKSEKPASIKTGCVILGVFENHRLSAAAALFDKSTRGLLTRLLQAGDLDGKLEQTLIVHHPQGAACERVLLIGCGKHADFNAAAYRKVIASAAHAIDASGATDAVSYLADLEVSERDSAWKIATLAELTRGTLYVPDELKSIKDKKSRPLRRMGINVDTTDAKAARAALAEGLAIANGVELARRLGNLPGNICTPAYLAKQAQSLARSHKSLRTSIIEEKKMRELGMGALLSVTAGTDQPAKLIVMQYQGAAKTSKPHVLVGKGITFDSGGISLKPGAKMDEMKYDMGGAASVMGTMSAICELGLKLNVVAIIAAAENLPSGSATKPGDVVTSMSGQTIEVLNTDAEGRLVLCDALSYAARFKPASVIDIATLTGACVVALGSHATGLFSNQDDFASELLKAGNEVNDRAWQMPLWDDYQPQLNSNFADMANIGGPEAGSVTAACFLSRFTRKFRWAHLDIAGTAWVSGANKGATGRPVGLLTQYLIHQSGN